MYCINCGKQIEDGARFCEHCGAPVKGGAPAGVGASEGSGRPADGRVSVNGGKPAKTGMERMPMAEEQAGVPEERRAKKKYGLFLLLGLLAILAIGAAVWFLFFGKGGSGRAGEQLRLGNRYLEEMDYEQAVVAFTKAIEIEPKEVDAYIGASKAYAGLKSYWDALEVLDAGYVQTKAAEIAERGKDVCLEAAEYSITEEAYEEAQKYIEKGNEYGGSEELGQVAERLEEISASEGNAGSEGDRPSGDEAAAGESRSLEEDSYEPPCTWVVEPAIEADNIYYLNSNDTLKIPVNQLYKQMEENYGYAVVKNGDSYGLIGFDGNLFEGLEFLSVGTFLSRYYVACAEPQYAWDTGTEETELYLTDQGLAYPFSYGAIYDLFGGVYFWNDGLRQFYRFDGMQLPEPEAPIPVFQRDGESGKIPEGLADWYVNPNGKYAVYSGGSLKTDFIYDECGSYSDGLLAVCRDGKWGYVDGEGQVVIPLEYDASWKEFVVLDAGGDAESGVSGVTEMREYCYGASGGYVTLCQGGEWELRNTRGEEVIRKGYFEEIRPVYDGKCWVKKDGKWGVIQVGP